MKYTTVDTFAFKWAWGVSFRLKRGAESVDPELLS